MAYILDGIIVLLILFISYLSAKKGFVYTLLELIGFAAAIYITLTVSTPISNVVYDKIIEPSIIQTVENTAEIGVDNIEGAVNAVWDEMPQYVTESNYFNLSKENVITTVKKENVQNNTQIAQAISKSFVKPTFVKWISTITEIILLILLFLLVKLIAKYVNKLFSFSFVGGINKFLGGIIGIIKGGAIAVIFCLIISLIMSFTKNGFLIFTDDTINASHIFKFFMGFSPFI